MHSITSSIVLLAVLVTASQGQVQDNTLSYQQEEPPDSIQRNAEMQRFYQEQDPEPRQRMMEEQEPDQRYSLEDKMYTSSRQQVQQQAHIKHGTLEGDDDGDDRMEGDDYRMEDDDDSQLESDDEFHVEGDDDFRREGDDDFRREGDDDFHREGDDDFRREGDDDGIQRRKSNIEQELASLQTEGHTKAPKPKKITFEDNTDIEALVQRMSAMEETQEVLEQDDDDDVMSQWVMVTSEGYEFAASQDEINSVLHSEADDLSDVFEMSEPSDDALGARFEDSINATGQRVFGRDTRFRIYNSFRYPKSAMGQVGYGCTGTFISRTHILTAGHCVYNPYRRRWLRNLNFRRGRNGRNYGVFYRWKYAVTVRGWMRGKQNYNYAVIVVRKRSPTWMSYGYRSPMPRYYVNIVGYPFDKPGRYMWQSYCRIRSVYYHTLSYYCDTSYGMSGAAVYARLRYRRRRYSVIYGVHVGYRWYRNRGTRINKRKFRTIRHITRRYR